MYGELRGRWKEYDESSSLPQNLRTIGIRVEKSVGPARKRKRKTGKGKGASGRRTLSGFVYVLRCNDNTLYCGSTTDLERRLHQHNHTQAGAKYTRARRPVVCVLATYMENIKDARRAERLFKRLRTSEKRRIVEEQDEAAIRNLLRK